MAQSLLAHLYTYIKGSQEDIATFSLQYLLSQSNKLNAAFTKFVAQTTDIQLDETLRYNCQVTGDSEEKERPDMVGVDADGVETVLFEMKFYASLTKNQPNTYLDRLRKNKGKGLLFVCPTSRKTSLWAKLQELSHSEANETKKYCTTVDGVSLAITTWSEILTLLKQEATAMDNSFIPDIIQLEGYCNKMDSDAFIPFNATDLSAKMARMGERYYSVVDEVIDQLVAKEPKRTSRKGLKATGHRKGYLRSLYIGDIGITLNYDRDAWKDPASVETPFWFAISNDQWEQTGKIKNYLKNFPDRMKAEIWGKTNLALEALQDEPFTTVCENLAEQILEHIKQLYFPTE